MSIQDILKFSVQFDIPDVLEQVVAWIDRTVNAENIVQLAKVAGAAVRCAKMHGRIMEVDPYWPCKRYIVQQNNESIEEIISQIVLNESAGIIFEMFLNDKSFSSERLIPQITSLK